MYRTSISFTTATDGTATASADALIGKLFCVEYQPGDVATGATLALTCEAGLSKPLLTVANAGTVGWWKYPREVQHSVTDGTPLPGLNAGDRTPPIVNGILQVAVTGGGSVKTGKVIFYIDEA